MGNDPSITGYLFTTLGTNALPSSAGAWIAAKYDFIPGIFRLKVFQLFHTYFCPTYPTSAGVPLIY